VPFAPARPGTYWYAIDMIRAEPAGIDPEKDVEVTVGAGYLTIRAERHDKTGGKHRTEFRYGS
jgi:HSP20 family molecular chaperone IbpA